jgi:hypothetical protein
MTRKMSQTVKWHVLASALATLSLSIPMRAGAEPPIHGHGDVGAPEHGRGGPGRLSGGNIFFSPMGRPYRGRPGAPYAVALWFDAANTAHDGKLTLAEFRADAKAFFEELDSNHDGIIDGFEVTDYEQDVAPEIIPSVGRLRPGEGLDPNLELGDTPRRGGGGGGGRERQGGGGSAGGRPRAGDESPQGAGLFSLINEPEPVSATDTDFTGKITLAQWMAAADRRFKLLDPAGRGYVTLADLPHTPAQEIYEARMAAKANGRERFDDDRREGPPR